LLLLLPSSSAASGKIIIFRIHRLSAVHPKIGHHDIYPRLPLCHQNNVGHFPQQAKSWIRRFFYRLVSQQQLRSQGSAAFLPKLFGKELPCITLFSEGSKPPNGTNSIHGHKSSGLVFTTSSHHPRRRRTSPPRHGPRGHTGSLTALNMERRHPCGLQV
jgi:hypothetical protein